jgi:hypothetical protein
LREEEAIGGVRLPFEGRATMSGELDLGAAWFDSPLVRSLDEEAVVDEEEEARGIGLARVEGLGAISSSSESEAGKKRSGSDLRDVGEDGALISRVSRVEKREG